MDLTKVISKIDGVTNGLLYCILSTSRFKEHALGYVNGTTVLHMSKKAVPEYTCAFHKDINQIRNLCITLDAIYKRMAVTYDENSRLSLLRYTLLPKRFLSGWSKSMSFIRAVRSSPFSRNPTSRPFCIQSVNCSLFCSKVPMLMLVICLIPSSNASAVHYTRCNI